MAKATIINSNGPVITPAAGATLASVTVAAAQAKGWQNGTVFYFKIVAYINGTTVETVDDDNVKILENGTQIAAGISVPSNPTSGTPASPTVFEGNAIWNGVNAPIQIETIGAGTTGSVYHATVMATQIDTTDDLPT